MTETPTLTDEQIAGFEKRLQKMIEWHGSVNARQVGPVLSFDEACILHNAANAIRQLLARAQAAEAERDRLRSRGGSQ